MNLQDTGVATLDLRSFPGFILIDMQAGTVGQHRMAHSIDDVVGRAAALIEHFRNAGAPVAFVRHLGTPPGRTTYRRGGAEWPPEHRQLLPELQPEEGDIEIGKRAWSAFAGTDLEGRLRSVGVNTVIIAGVSTSFGVESTARAAYDLGFDVLVVADATTDMSLSSHQHTLRNVVPALGRTVRTEEVIRALTSRAR